MLYRLVIAFLPRIKRLLMPWLQSPSAVILEPKKIKSGSVSSVFPSFGHEVMGLCAMILVLWMWYFKPAFHSSLSSSSKLCSSFSLSAIKVVLFAYLRLLAFLLRILNLASASSSLAFLLMYTAYMLNKQGENI